MKHLRSAACATAFVALLSSATAGITIGPVHGQPGRVSGSSRFPKPRAAPSRRAISAESSSGKVEITRERDLVWTFRAPAADGTRRGMVRVPSFTTTSKTVIDGKEEKTTDESPLVGKMFSMSKSPGQRLEFRTRRLASPRPRCNRKSTSSRSI